MFRRNYLTVFLTIALFLVGGTAIFAQSAPVRGVVQMKGADGKPTPIKGAVVEVFRLDIKIKLPSATTDKKGVFNFAGLPLGAVFVLSVSGPGISPTIVPNVKAGMDGLVVDVKEGDGRKWTEDEVQKALAADSGGGGGNSQKVELTAEQKKQQAEFEKKNAEITAQNEKIKKSNDIIGTTSKEGRAAYEAGNYDLAIAKFDEGYNADPTFEESATFMLSNKAAALVERGKVNYNKLSKTDEASRPALRESIKKDFADAIAASDKALDILKTATSTNAEALKNFQSSKTNALINRKNAYRLMAQTGFDREKSKEATAAFQEYMAIETDSVKKAKAQSDLAATLQDSGEYEAAVTEYKKVLETDPNNVDALAGAGLNLVTVGYITMEGDSTKGIAANPATGKAQLQEAANLLQKFIDVAPADNKLLASVKESINDLKAAQNLTPQKVKTTTTKKKN